MPDDITPEPTGDAPSGDGGENTETPESWDTATQATPADATRSDLTEATPVATTRSMAATPTPPAGTPATASDDLAAGAAADSAGTGGRGKSSSRRAWIIALVVAAVLLAGGESPWPCHRGGRRKIPPIPQPTSRRLRQRRQRRGRCVLSPGSHPPGVRSRSVRLWP